ncbi:hypothetical protein IWW38_005250 [Coemansia aciculifera]|uniref:Uncharacterized protein n=1 Tax=Coemansia aciculifera TaxID=417176 RepID=A0ACC1LVK1_9FUNG|nr:hypothetical protein IWW38_005250 [Coemansia aciculifera]
MDALFSKLDDQVEATLQTLFPPASKSPPIGDAHHRAQEFSRQVGLVNSQLSEIKSKLDSIPSTDSSPHAALQQEIDELRKDIRLKEEVLDKHRKTLSECAAKLQQVDAENRLVIERQH